MKKSLLLCLALFATSSFAYVGSIPISQTQNVSIKQTKTSNVMSQMSTKVRIYNDSSQSILVSAYYVDSNWDYASSWQPSKGYSVDMKNNHPEEVPANSWIDIYSADNSNIFSPIIKYNVLSKYFPDDISFTFANISVGAGRPMDFYYGYDSSPINKIHFSNINARNISGNINVNDTSDGYYDINTCTAVVINNSSVVIAPNLDRDTCELETYWRIFNLYQKPL